jgi:hypothetical protein
LTSHTLPVEGLLRRRRRSRGAVAIEALIIASLLVTVLGAGVFMHRAYATKLRMVREARVAAWLPALRGCGKTPDQSSMTQTAAGLGEEGGNSVSPETFTTWTASTEHGQPRSEAVEGANGFGSFNTGSKNQVTCNPVGSDEEGIELIADVMIRAIRRE